MKAILCDDDEIILEGITKCTHWENYSIELVGTAKNGRTALSLIENNDLDLIITDIQMPFYTGLELVKIAQQKNPMIIAIMISGYNDFEYARKSIKLGVLDYISKPIDIDEFNAVLFNAFNFYNKNKISKNQERISALNEILYEDHENISSEAKQFLLEYKNCCCVSIILELDEYKLVMLNKQEDENLSCMKRFEEIIRKCSEKSWLLVNRQEYSVHLIMIEKEKAVIEKEMNNLKRFISSFNKSSVVKITLAFGNLQSKLKNIDLSLKEAKAALQCKFIKGIGSIIMFSEVVNYTQDISNLDITFDIDIPVPMNIREINEINDIIMRLRMYLEKNSTKMEALAKIIISNWYISTSKELIEYGYDLSEIFDRPGDEFEKINLCTDINIMLEYFKDVFMKIYEFILKNKQGKYISVITKATKYIKDNYMKPELSIEEVSNYLSLSVGYFSLIFHKETNETFTDYLIRVRLDKAKDLIVNSNLKLYEISNLVGYENATYFSTIFKKNVGFSPSEFKLKL